MKTFNLKTKSFLDINRKEDMNSDMFIITDLEYYEILETLQDNGYFWVENNELKYSRKRPTTDYIWDEESKSWILSAEIRESRLLTEKNEVWEKIKQVRSKHQSTGVKVGDKWFHTDQEALMNYAIYNITINYPETEPSQWKTMDGSYTLMTPDLFKSVMLSISKKGNDDFKNAEIHRMKLWQSNDPYSYDYSTGWSEGHNTKG